LISHFFNEAYLLPWWLNHHREMFDHGILIDYHSTDQSREICRELVPHWDLVTSENEKFAAIPCDFEVMKYEQNYRSAWKIALNTTEFLMANLDGVENEITAADSIVGKLEAAIMVDGEPGVSPAYERPLVDQKNMGFWENDLKIFSGESVFRSLRRSPDAFFFNKVSRHGFFNKTAITDAKAPLRGRIYHRYEIGSYAPGRHSSFLPRQVAIPRKTGSIWWYGFSPWNDAFLSRKLQIDATRDPFDKKHRLGVQHAAKMDVLQKIWEEGCSISAPL
jgi:hypothetical protein